MPETAGHDIPNNPTGSKDKPPHAGGWENPVFGFKDKESLKKAIELGLVHGVSIDSSTGDIIYDAPDTLADVKDPTNTPATEHFVPMDTLLGGGQSVKETSVGNDSTIKTRERKVSRRTLLFAGLGSGLVAGGITWLATRDPKSVPAAPPAEPTPSTTPTPTEIGPSTTEPSAAETSGPNEHALEAESIEESDQMSVSEFFDQKKSVQYLYGGAVLEKNISFPVLYPSDTKQRDKLYYHNPLEIALDGTDILNQSSDDIMAQHLYKQQMIAGGASLADDPNNPQDIGYAEDTVTKALAVVIDTDTEWLNQEMRDRITLYKDYWQNSQRVALPQSFEVYDVGENEILKDERGREITVRTIGVKKKELQSNGAVTTRKLLQQFAYFEYKKDGETIGDWKLRDEMIDTSGNTP